MGSMDFRAETRQQQTLSPRLQHAVRLLQLSSLEFAQQVHDALGKNPFLEEDGEAEDGAEGATDSEEAAAAADAL
ncbi:MAG TPA: RNA polymerase sigma-54 factor, partial [Burkholderiaceae bacterium]|nr:RNA polymerase sigma-54 factor [Burkholderiaceae bacterium]